MVCCLLCKNTTLLCKYARELFRFKEKENCPRNIWKLEEMTRSKSCTFGLPISHASDADKSQMSQFKALTGWHL